MSDNIKYYYLKLKDNFYDSEELIILQNMPDGYLYSDILMKLYLRSLKSEGKLMFNDYIPYNAEVLAQIVRHQVGTVEKALKIFQNLGLVEILDNGAIYMLDIQNLIGKSSTEADRKRNYRARINAEKQKLLNSGQMSGQMSDSSDGQMSDQMSGQTGDKNPPEIEIEKEIKKEIEKDIKKEEKTNEDFSDVVKFYENNIDLITKNKAMILSEYLDKFNKDIIIYAIQIAVEDKARNIKYIETILENWLKANIKSLEEAKDYTKKLKDYKAKKESKNNEETTEEQVNRLFGGDEW